MRRWRGLDFAIEVVSLQMVHGRRTTCLAVGVHRAGCAVRIRYVYNLSVIQLYVQGCMACRAGADRIARYYTPHSECIYPPVARCRVPKSSWEFNVRKSLATACGRPSLAAAKSELPEGTFYSAPVSRFLSEFGVLCRVERALARPE